jgi:hypothetical protein
LNNPHTPFEEELGLSLGRLGEKLESNTSMTLPIN